MSIHVPLTFGVVRRVLPRCTAFIMSISEAYHCSENALLAHAIFSEINQMLDLTYLMF